MILFSADSYKYDPFSLFDKVEQVKRVEDLPKENSAVILWGGTDIPPKLYGEKPNKFVINHYESSRDVFEIQLVKYCLKHQIPLIGICRGAQLICALTGGKLVQHIEEHGRSHKVTLHDEGDAVLTCNSSHHQMMVPGPGSRILATAEGTVGLNQDNHGINIPRVNEVVVWPALKAIGIQAHPEWDNCPTTFVDYCARKVKEYIL